MSLKPSPKNSSNSLRLTTGAVSKVHTLCEGILLPVLLSVSISSVNDFTAFDLLFSLNVKMANLLHHQPGFSYLEHILVSQLTRRYLGFPKKDK